MPAASPGSFLLLEAVFEEGRAAFGFLGERGVRAEVLGDRAARTLLKFLDAEGAVDPHLADQLAVPLALAGGGGPRDARARSRAHLRDGGRDVSRCSASRPRTWGRRGGPGGLEVGRVLTLSEAAASIVLAGSSPLLLGLGAAAAPRRDRRRPAGPLPAAAGGHARRGRGGV